MKRSSIQTRMFLGILTLVLVLGVLAIGTVAATRDMAAAMRQVGTETSVELSDAAAVCNLVLQMDASLQRYTTTGNPADAVEARSISGQVDDAFQQALAGPYTQTSETNALQQARLDWVMAADAAATILASRPPPDPAMLGAFETHLRAAARGLDTLRQVTVQEAQGEMHTARVRAARANMFAGALLLAGFLAAGIAVVVLPRSVIRPLARLRNAMRSVANGSLEEEVPTSDTREIDELAQSFNAMVAQLRASTGELVNQIVERERAEERVRYLALHDPLTDLPNRTLFNDRFEMALALARRTRRMLAVLFIDLDRFKLVNDTAGHGSGDLVLQAVTARLRGLLREGDMVARPGGDEFTILLTNIARRADVAEIGERVLQALHRSVSISGRDFLVTASIGASLFPRDGEDAQTLLRNADTALYFAKEQGRDNLQFFDSVKAEQMGNRIALVDALRGAVERTELVLYYQPLVTASTGAISTVEALVRWQHPQRGLLDPEVFIPVAEESGLIVPLGDWVLGEACAQLKAWHDAGIQPLRMAVNVSANQLRCTDIVNSVRRHLDETRIDPSSLKLEITESAFMSDPAGSAGVLRQLRALGLQIAIDDFGTGYSSLSRLKDLPVDELKIDRTFVEGIGSGVNDGVLASVVVALAHGLKIAVTAEGVETQEQLDFLTARGCDSIQGFFFSRPLPAEAAEKLLVQRQGLKAA